MQELRDIWTRVAATLEERLDGVVAYETAAVQEALEGRTIHLFVRWLSDFYHERLPEVLIDALANGFEELAGWTGAAVVASLGEEWTQALADQIDSYAREVLESEANGYSASHRRQIEALIRDEGNAEGEGAARAGDRGAAAGLERDGGRTPRTQGRLRSRQRGGAGRDGGCRHQPDRVGRTRRRLQVLPGAGWAGALDRRGFCQRRRLDYGG